MILVQIKGPPSVGFLREISPIQQKFKSIITIVVQSTNNDFTGRFKELRYLSIK